MTNPGASPSSRGAPLTAPKGGMQGNRGSGESGAEGGTQVSSDSGLASWTRKHPFIAYALRRLGLYVIEIWGAITIAFFFFRLIPGDPIQTLLTTLQRQYGSDSKASAEIIERYRTEFGLDGNLFEQYVRYLRKLLVEQDMGPSLLAYPTPSQDLIFAALPWTIGLLGVSAVLAWVLGIAMGVMAAWRRGKKDAEMATNVAIVMGQIPYYFVALVLVYVFAYVLNWFPGRSAYNSNIEPGFSWEFITSVLYHAALPGLSMVIIGALGWLLSTRMLMLPILGEDFLHYAEAKGLPPRVVLSRYAVRNCYLPQVTAFGIGLGFIFNGNVLVEQLFSYPGIGQVLVNAIGQLDFNTILGVTNVAILTVLSANLLLDFMLPFLDPRVTYWK